MRHDITQLVRDSAPRPEDLEPIDPYALIGRARKRQWSFRIAAAASVVVVMVGAVVAVGSLTDRGVVIGDGGFAGSGTDWGQMTLDEAAGRLRTVAADHARLPERASGQTLDVRWVAASRTGRVTAEVATTDLVLRLAVHGRRVSGDGGRWLIEQQLGVVEPGATFDEVRTRLADRPAPDRTDVRAATEFPEGSTQANDEALEDAERLVATDGRTAERPNGAYALVRLRDALISAPADPDLLARAYDVLAKADGRWVDYIGVTTDVLGRDGIGFETSDPGSGSRTVLVFDPDTGRLHGTIDYPLAPSGDPDPELAGATAVEFVLTR